MQGVKQIRVTRERNEDENGEPLSPIARMCHEPGNDLYTISIVGFNTQINPDVLKANLVHSMLKNPRFSSLQVMDENGVLRWVPTKVDMNNHIIIPEAHNSSDDTIVENYIHKLTKTTINMSIMPMWDVHILNVKTIDAESTCIFRVHHSVGDGISLMSILLTSSHQELALPRKKNNSKHNSILIIRLFVKFLSVLIVTWNTMVDLVLYCATLWFLKDTNTPLKDNSSGLGTNGQRVVYRIFPLDDIKLVKNVMGTTVNDVVVGITQAGLSRYLNNRYVRVGESIENVDERSNHLPNNIRLRGCMIVNLRSSHQICGTTNSNWGNKLGHVIFPLTIAIKDDPLDYVRDAKATMDRKKASLEATYTYLMAKFFLPIIAPKLVIAAARITLMFSNIPGPREEKIACGYPISFIASSIYGQSLALVIHVTSYCNKIAFAVAVNDNVIPNPYELLDDIEESFNLIKDAAMAEM